VATLQTQIAAVSGLSSTTVIVGYVMQPPSTPFVMLADLAQADAEQGATLDAYTHTWSMTVVGWASATTDSYLARLQAACDLYDLVLRGIASDRTLGGKARNVWPSSPQIGATMDGTAPSYGFFQVDVMFEIKIGVGA
jgi:hypothetical protein